MSDVRSGNTVGDTVAAGLADPLQAARFTPREGLTAGSVEIDRVIDVPLAVTLRFGQREMRLREVLELSAGSLIELDRQIEDPVDLLLGDRIIARGEVIIVDGNYGLRVTEVLQGGSAMSQ